jgi:alanine racemase
MAFLKIEKDALINNLRLICAKAKDKNKVAVVLKDNAYGHGIDNVALVARAQGIKHCVVRDIKEASFVERLFDTVLLLNPTKVKLKDHMHQTINHIGQIDIIKEGSSVELKVDCGMHRNGLEMDEIDEVLNRCEDKKLQVKGIFTHHKSADMLTSEFFWQRKNFEAMKQKYAHLGVRFHSFNSAALFRAQEFDDDIARVGIATYGYVDYEKGLNAQGLRPVMSLWANKIATKTIKKGQRIGYGGIFEAKSDCVVSTYDAGYADGVFRINPENPILLANNTPVLGKVSMDSLSAYGDAEELCIFDDAKKLAKHFNTISYEVLVSMKDSLQRVQV